MQPDPPPVSFQTCWTCDNAMFSENLTHCSVFNESILSEVLAGRDCPAYDPCEELR